MIRFRPHVGPFVYTSGRHRRQPSLWGSFLGLAAVFTFFMVWAIALINQR